MNSRIETGVKSEAALIKNLALPGERIVRLDATIVIRSLLYIPESKTVSFGRHKLHKSEKGEILFYGFARADRQQIFSGFAAGDIKGTFGGADVCPEWWGLEDKRHDIAINAAIQSSPAPNSARGHKVSLAPRRYEVSAPIDLSSLSVRLEGAGSGATQLFSTTEWTPDKWEHCSQWASRPSGNHSSMVWMGSALGTGTVNSFYGGIKGITINAYYAACKYPDKYVSGISTRSFIEENSIIDDIGVSYASGCGIGFPAHYKDGNLSPVVLNGLHITNFWIGTCLRRDSVPVYFPMWANNCLLRSGTVDMRLNKSMTRLAEVGGPEGGADIGVYPKPPQVFDWPAVGIIAQGKSSVDMVHIEGCGIGVLVPVNNAVNHVRLTSIDGFCLMDKNQVYYNDGFGLKDTPPTNTTFHDYGTVVLIGRDEIYGPQAGFNPKDSVDLSDITAKGSCRYILRDAYYGHNISAFGHGQFPAGGSGTVTSYSRGSGWINTPDGSGGYTQGAYAGLSPLKGRHFFTGPVY